MEVTCKIESILSEQRFNGRSGEVVRYGFVGVTGGQWPKKVKFDVIGADRWEKISQYVQVGADSQVFFDVESREWQGKWFTSLIAFKVTSISGNVQQQQNNQSTQQVQQQQSQPASANTADDVPF